MPDWQDLVRRRLSGLAFDAEQKEEVHAELAAHLQDSYEFLCRRGLTEQEAIHGSLAQVSDWQELQRNIYLTRMGNTMTNRVKQLWLPGLLTFTLSVVLMELAQKFGPPPHILSLVKDAPVLMFYTAWLFVLPLAGAIGAFLAKRAGGSPSTVLLSSIFPVLPFVVVFMVAIPVGLAMGHSLMPAAYLAIAIGWVLAPGVALLAGGLLVQLISSRGSANRGLTAR